MKKRLIILTLLFNVTFIVPVMAGDASEQFGETTKYVMDQTSYIEYSPGFALVDLLIYRPLGLVSTIVGSALFVGFSPFTALAQISPPHDAFEKTADILVVTPYELTFSRPLGEWEISK